MIRMTLILTISLLIHGCGGSDNEKPSQEASRPAVKNPLAAEQQLIKDSAQVQDILDQDAERKKQAIKDALK